MKIYPIMLCFILSLSCNETKKSFSENTETELRDDIALVAKHTDFADLKRGQSMSDSMQPPSMEIFRQVLKNEEIVKPAEEAIDNELVVTRHRSITEPNKAVSTAMKNINFTDIAANTSKIKIVQNNRHTTGINAKLERDEIVSKPIMEVKNQSTVIENIGPEKITEIVFRRNFFNFDTIEAGTVIEFAFEFTNTGEHPLYIKEATATCGCTYPTFPIEPIMPGKSGVIGGKYDSRDKFGAQNAMVKLVTNTTPPINKLYINGNVTPSGI